MPHMTMSSMQNLLVAPLHPARGSIPGPVSSKLVHRLNATHFMLGIPYPRYKKKTPRMDLLWLMKMMSSNFYDFAEGYEQHTYSIYVQPSEQDMLFFMHDKMNNYFKIKT